MYWLESKFIISSGLLGGIGLSFSTPCRFDEVGDLSYE